MKFCYLDESGTGSEPFAVMVGVIVDSQRMSKTKQDWADLLQRLTKLLGRPIVEFHTRDFYRGNGPWRGLPGKDRSTIVVTVMQWLIDRKHKVTFTALDKARYLAEVKINPLLKDFHSLWCFMAYHQALSLQKAFQSMEKSKGNTVMIFDREEQEEKHFCKLVSSPPAWTDQYYSKGKKQERLDQIIDVPYFGDSEQVHLLQVADLIAYFLRLYLEIESGSAGESYKGEHDFLRNFVIQLKKVLLPVSSRYLSKGRDECAELYYQMAPAISLTI